MGGTSSTAQTQNSTTNPWAPAQGDLTGILGQVGQNLNNTGVTGTENNALNSTVANANNYSANYAPQIGANATNLLNGGGANNQAGAVQGGFNTFQQQMTPYANGSMIGNNPALQAQLAQIQTDVGNSVNGQFAAAGRDFSGANQMAYGRGVASGEAPVIAAQYNQDVANQMGASNALYNGSNTNSGILSGMQNQFNANQQQGTQASGDALNAQNTGANAALQAEAQRRNIPVQALGLLAQIGIPIAGLGGQSTGTSTGTNTMSGAQQFQTIASGIGNLMPKVNFNVSDRRAKEDIAQVGTLFDGTPVYRFRYIGQPAFHIGLMAQDIEKTMPEAVGQIGPYKAVDYKLATDRALEIA